MKNLNKTLVVCNVLFFIYLAFASQQHSPVVPLSASVNTGHIDPVEDN